MRSDMYEILIERPRAYRGCRARVGCTYPRKKLARAREQDDLPRKESMGALYAEKSLNENLRPLVRYLRSNVGRPWSKVSSEIHAQVNGRSAVQGHILQHLSDFVEVNVREVSGVLYGAGRYGGPFPLAHHRRRESFFVCPRSGLLRAIPVRPRKQKSRIPDPNFRKVDECTYWMKRTGGWFEVVLQDLPSWSETTKAHVDVLTRAHVRTVKHRQTVLLWNCPWASTHFAVRTRQLGKREIRAAFE